MCKRLSCTTIDVPGEAVEFLSMLEKFFLTHHQNCKPCVGLQGLALEL